VTTGVAPLDAGGLAGRRCLSRGYATAGNAPVIPMSLGDLSVSVTRAMCPRGAEQRPTGPGSPRRRGRARGRHRPGARVGRCGRMGRSLRQRQILLALPRVGTSSVTTSAACPSSLRRGHGRSRTRPIRWFPGLIRQPGRPRGPARHRLRSVGIERQPDLQRRDSRLMTPRQAHPRPRGARRLGPDPEHNPYHVVGFCGSLSMLRTADRTLRPPCSGSVHLLAKGIAQR